MKLRIPGRRLRTIFGRCGAGVAGLTALLMTGCDSGAAAQRLQAEAPQLVQLYVNSELNRQIKLNAGQKAFNMSENRVFLIGEDGCGEDSIGARMTESPHSDLAVFMAGRFYIAAEVFYEIGPVVIGEVRKTDGGRFSHRSVLRVRLRIVKRTWERCMGRGVFGVVFAAGQSPEMLKRLALRRCAEKLPAPEMDYESLYVSEPQEVDEESDATIFVNYDPALPGWVPENVDVAANRTLQGAIPEWHDARQQARWAPPDGVVEYQGRLFLAEDVELLKKYDAGQVCRNRVWMSVQAANEMSAVTGLRDGFNVREATLGDLNTYMVKLAQYPQAPGVESAYADARTVAARLIRKWADDDNLDELKAFSERLRLPEYAPLKTELEAPCAAAVAEVTARCNRRLEERIERLHKLAEEIEKLRKMDGPWDAAWFDIVLARFASRVGKDCPAKAAAFTVPLLRVRAAYALRNGDVEYVNRMYRHNATAAELRKVENQILAPCSVCRQGVVRCENCSGNGKCSVCGGEGLVHSEICTACGGRGSCGSCRGSKNMPCPHCHGRKFVVRATGVSQLLNDNIDTITELLREECLALTARKLN